MSHWCLRDYSTFQLYEIIPFGALRETYCIPKKYINLAHIMAKKWAKTVFWPAMRFELCTPGLRGYWSSEENDFFNVFYLQPCLMNDIAFFQGCAISAFDLVHHCPGDLQKQLIFSSGSSIYDVTMLGDKEFCESLVY